MQTPPPSAALKGWPGITRGVVTTSRAQPVNPAHGLCVHVTFNASSYVFKVPRPLVHGTSTKKSVSRTVTHRNVTSSQAPEVGVFPSLLEAVCCPCLLQLLSWKRGHGQGVGGHLGPSMQRLGLTCPWCCGLRGGVSTPQETMRKGTSLALCIWTCSFSEETPMLPGLRYFKFVFHWNCHLWICGYVLIQNFLIVHSIN